MISSLLLLALPPVAQPMIDDLDHFERRIRPVLIERCYRCHNSVDRREGDLALDHAAGLLQGGGRGPAIVSGDPDASLLLRAVRHEVGAPSMPEDEPILEPHEIEALARWIRAGAVDPRDAPPSAAEFAEETSWEAIRERRLAWWSFQPIVDPPPPTVHDETWPDDPLDHFVLATLEANGERPAPDADRATLLRRASFVLTGLPPTATELAAFLADDRSNAYEREVVRLLESPHYGERMARRWMDIFRYAESHGSEGDPTIPYAWRYRDYLVRAFESDVPWDRLVQEQVAGDLLTPRLDSATGINEAAIGPGNLRFVQHGYAPTEPLVDQVQFIDDQIDVLSKAVLGLTVSCARCHDHKFDPISQTDYYALYGVLASVRPAVRTVDDMERRQQRAPELRAVKSGIRSALADAWRASLPDLTDRMHADGPALEEARKSVENDTPHALGLWAAALDGADVRHRWADVTGHQRASRLQVEHSRSIAAAQWDLSTPQTSKWYAHGSVFDGEPARPGDFAVLPAGERVLTTVLPGGVYTHLLSSRHSGVFASPSFAVQGGSLWVRAMGGGGARARYAMQLHPRVSGPTYKAHNLDAPTPRWLRWDMSYWAGDLAHIEFATASDIPVEARTQERSFWGVTEARLVPPGGKAPRDEWFEFLTPSFFKAPAPDDVEALAEHYLEALKETIERWSRDEASDRDARFLDPFVRHGLLPVELAELPSVAPLVELYRSVEAEVPIPVRAPGVLPGDRVDQPLFTRGDRRHPTEPVPQRFLEWLDPTPYSGDGRLELARDLVRPDNPLTPRVAVNRLWTWVFGEGLVATVDNFGRLGAEPADPQLLDHLASRFVADRWSVKRMLRALLTSRTFRQQAAPRRLDAESLRDSLLLVSGRLDPTRFGPSVDERSPRRSLYVAQRRTSPQVFLSAFDQPAPHSTVGRRSVTNVPAQALALLNDPLVSDCAQYWAERAMLETPGDRERVRHMLLSALGHQPTTGAEDRALQFVSAISARVETARKEADSLATGLTADEVRVAALLEAGRTRVRGERGLESSPLLPQPLARWEFDGDLSDGVGALTGVAHGDARVEDGRLVLGGTGFMTAPLASDLSAKTLEVWVQLTDLDQTGCGVLTVQTTDGIQFDSVVFAERQPRRWIAGSNNFRRTQDVTGTEEQSPEFVHVAITYDPDGTIRLYRDGVPYGEPYRPGPAVRFEAGGAEVLLGARHGTAGSLRGLMRGSIERAQLHDRALDAEEVAASSTGDPNFVPAREALAALSAEEAAELEALRTSLAARRSRLVELEPALEGGPHRRWRELAHALFQLEEFRFVR